MAMLSTAMPAKSALALSSRLLHSPSQAYCAAGPSSPSPSLLQLAPFRPSLPLFLSPIFHRSASPKRSLSSESSRLLCKAAEYKFPDPIPEFAESETSKFRTHMLERLTKKKEYFGDSVGEIVDVCTEIFNNFLHTEYGGPGTLLVIPFIDMADTLRERGLPGAPQAARAAVVWAQKHVDKDWNEWNGGEDSASD